MIKFIKPVNHSKGNKRVVISRTEGEWEEIDRRLKDLGKSNLNSYLRCEISKLQKRFEECPSCITPAHGKQIIKQHRVSDAVYDDLCQLSKIMNQPISSMIEDFFIVPLLLPGMA